MQQQDIRHTPGPWRAIHAFDGSVRVVGGTEATRLQTIATLWKTESLREQQSADAALIAKAPELLTWCAKAAQMAQQQFDHASDDDAPMPRAWLWLAERLRAAVTEAQDITIA